MDNYFNFSTILYVEDEEGIRKETSKALERYAKELFVAKDGEEGLALYKECNPDIVITDIKMPNMTGIDMSKAIKEINPEQAIIITTAHSESTYFMEAIELQLSGYILKPVDKILLKNKIVEIVKNLQIKKEFQKNKNLMEEIANLQNNIIIVYDELYEMIFANKMFLDFFAIKNIEEFIKRYGCIESAFIQHNDFYFRNNHGINHWLLEIAHYNDKKRIVSIIDHRDMSPKSFLIKTKTIQASGHKICTFTEITTMVKEKEELEKKAFIDELTNIANRAKFNQILDIEIKKFKRYKENLSLVMLDIDYFKSINDTYGHQVGDIILSSLSNLISSNIRDVDLFARWGGEEFVILLPNTDLQSAISFAEHIREYIQEYHFTNNLNITCSFGISEINEKDTGENLLKRVDDALYRAKRMGRNRVESL
ncbi:response regulator receiver modulated diguanylate cyclase [Sulfurimonas gotlandica GD1]|uniref:diguanylate cyclase n=1 Tax=Sulfurimonas gotlandica (strain DSM 19862 / JCM 16533 / GD1) TaxID=929558 RepID=B6BN46_SULGG|nr:diguanylate cyclase [Sulfurimonas gotlandica]EDZ61507.1 response regulator PleD [Sulfurimonas gotlandica GD1]EHP30677.1 response regulator receiver modulated diguanylate cyclase [Sulfurimonas gotlandica GD1]